MLDNKQQVLEDFLKSFRISLNYIFLYSKEHRSFIRSLTELQQKIEILFTFMNPIVIGFTPEALIIEDATYQKLALHKELAKLFHLRKIKSIKISRGVSVEELALVLEYIALPPKDLLKSGGLSTILRQSHAQNVSVEDLDYSQFLKAEGEEVQEVWSYLLKKATDKENVQKIAEFAQSFQANIGKLKARDFVENKELSQNLANFLVNLKDANPEVFRNCAQAMLKLMLKEKVDIPEADLETLKDFFKDLQEADIAAAFWDELATDTAFDSYSFQLFSRLVERQKHEKIVSYLAKSLEKNKATGVNPAVNKRIKELFSLSDQSFISTIYRKVLSSLTEGVSGATAFSFDRALLERNYRFVLINLLAEEKNTQRLDLILERIIEKWEAICVEKDAEYLKNLWEILEKIKKENLQLANLADLYKRFASFIENTAWDESPFPGFVYLADNLRESSLGADLYIRRICLEDKITPYSLKLFFKFFPDKIQDFYANLEKKHADLEFLVKIVQAAKTIDPDSAITLLKYIYSIANDLVKVEILEAMAGLSGYDKEFIFAILREASSFLKRPALQVVMKNEEDRTQALEILFNLSNPWGRRNNLLLENIALVAELDFKLARRYLFALSKKPFFWQRRVSKKAKEVLESWNVK